jgi:UDP-N-acetylglucosamine--N-acetylmuramyl-(pentapeptide) pyrophosphoryl-undecaprenol N-acetylglucosamine transferase
LAIGAATAAISRAGASSLAELAAARLPAVLIPFPAATDNHQFHNAHAFAETGAARLLAEGTARPEEFTEIFVELMCNHGSRRAIQLALCAWHKPQAAEQIAQAMLQRIRSSSPGAASLPECNVRPGGKSDCGDAQLTFLGRSADSSVSAVHGASVT